MLDPVYQLDLDAMEPPRSSALPPSSCSWNESNGYGWDLELMVYNAQASFGCFSAETEVGEKAPRWRRIWKLR
jgi:hypothetical protein